MAMKGFLLTAVVLAGAPAAVHAQSAYQYNRAAQAIQICASAMGAAIPECGQLRGAVGAPAISPAESAAAANLLSGLTGGAVPAAPAAIPGVGNAGLAGNLFGMAAQAYAASRQAPAAAAVPAPSGFPGGVPAGFPSSAGFPGAGAVDSNTSAALAIQNAGQVYRDCVIRVGATNAAGVQGCVSQFQAASMGGAPAAYANAAGFPGAATAGFPGGVAAGYPAAQAAPLASAAVSAFSALMGAR